MSSNNGAEEMNQKEVLDRIQLGISGLTGRVYLYIPSKKDPNFALQKRDITEDFIRFVKENGVRWLVEKEKK